MTTKEKAENTDISGIQRALKARFTFRSAMAQKGTAVTYITAQVEGLK